MTGVNYCDKILINKCSHVTTVKTDGGWEQSEMSFSFLHRFSRFMLTRKATGHPPVISLLKDKIDRHSAEKWVPVENGSLSIGASRLFPTSRRQAGQKCQCTKEPWRFAHCTAVTTCLAAFPSRKLPTRRGPHRAAFHCLGAAKSAIWHPAISLKGSSFCSSPASPRPMASRPVTFLFDLPPPLTRPDTHPEQAERRYIPPCVPRGCHVGLFSGATLTAVDWLQMMSGEKQKLWNH